MAALLVRDEAVAVDREERETASRRSPRTCPSKRKVRDLSMRVHFPIPKAEEGAFSERGEGG